MAAIICSPCVRRPRGAIPRCPVHHRASVAGQEVATLALLSSYLGDESIYESHQRSYGAAHIRVTVGVHQVHCFTLPDPQFLQRIVDLIFRQLVEIRAWRQPMRCERVEISAPLL